MTSWILITMYCMRTCVPMYAETFPDKASCVAHVPKTGTFEQATAYCVPLLVIKK